MDKNRVDGVAKQIEGKVQETAGKITGSTTEKLKGKAKVLEGKIQEGYGKGKDDARKTP